MATDRRIIAVDCETEPAKYGRVLAPFIWGVYDGISFRYFLSTREFVEWLATQNVIAYAHNGGKFDFMFLLQYIVAMGDVVKAQVINGRVVKTKLGRAELRDSYAAIPEALEKFGGKGKIDYDKMLAGVRNQHMAEILHYLEKDCVSLYNVMKTYRVIAGRKPTIASNALQFAKSLGVDMGKTNHTFDKKLRKFYYGGRCQLFRPGKHKNLRVIDIHSAYPYAMTFDHPSGSQFSHLSEEQFEHLPREEQQRGFVRLRCFSNMAFPVREPTGLEFHADYNEYHVTGWEYVAAKELGLISDVKILDTIVLSKTINFTPYVTHWYKYKDEHSSKDKETGQRIFPIEYEIGKRMMNSLYGKATQNPAKYFDYRFVPGGTPICMEYTPHGPNSLCKTCGEKGIDHGWSLGPEYEGIEIHRRAALWRYQYRFEKAWEGHPLYNNVATGASITGFTRAHLLRAIHAVGFNRIVYCDTDSIICDASASLEEIPMSDKLGDWADEGIATEGLFAGKKLYGLKLNIPCRKFQLDQETRVCKNCEHVEKGHGKFPQLKKATKGARLQLSQIQKVLDGDIVTWQNPFPHFSLAGRQIPMVRSIRSTGRSAHHTGA